MHVSSFIVIMVDWKLLSFMCIVTAFNMEDSERTQLLSDHGPDISPRIVVEVPRGNASADPARKKLRSLQTSSTSALDTVEVPNNPQTYISNTHSISLEDNHLDRLKISQVQHPTSQKKIINKKLQLLVYRVIFAPYYQYFHQIRQTCGKDSSQFAILQLFYYNKCNCILQLAWI